MNVLPVTGCVNATCNNFLNTKTLVVCTIPTHEIMELEEKNIFTNYHGDSQKGTAVKSTHTITLTLCRECARAMSYAVIDMEASQALYDYTKTPGDGL